MRERPHQYIAGDHLMVCDECGCVFRRSELRERWDHAWVCANDFEVRHPQEEVRFTRDKITVDVVRPEGAVSYVASSTEFPDMSVTTIAALMSLGSSNQAIYLQGRTVPGDGGQGIFRGTTNDISAQVASDPLRGIYIPLTIDTSGASGGWIRQDITPTRPEWWGGGSNLNSSDAINYASYFGNHIYLSGTDYLADKQLTGRTYRLFQGAGRGTTQLVKRFDGDLFNEFSECMGFVDITLEGDGENFTGRLLPVTGTAGRQYAHRFQFINSDEHCLDFATDAGSQSDFSDGKIYRYDGLTAGRYSIKIEDIEQLAAVPRKFTNIETDGTLCADLGGGGGAEFKGGFNGGFLFSDNTRAVYISDMRIGNISEMEVRGHNNVITGCGINPHITVMSGADNNVIENNSYNNGITDNSGNGRNLIGYPSVAYTPAWTGSTSNPDIGNGYLIGEQSRSGDKITVSIELSVGSTTTFGSGTWRISLPQTPTPTGGMTQMFPVFLTDNATTQTVGMAYVISGVGYIEISIPGGLDLVDDTHPWTWATGDMIRASFTYLV